MTPKDYEIQNLRRENLRLADELSKAMVGLFWLRGKYEEVEAKTRNLHEAFIKGAEVGMLTYLSLLEGCEPKLDKDDLNFNASINMTVLKAALRICMAMDMKSIEVKFEEAEE